MISGGFFETETQAKIRCVESIVFVLATVGLVAFFSILAVYLFKKIQMDIFFQIKHFNKKIFIPDRVFFEKYSDKSVLTEQDLIKISEDEEFMDHLMQKESDYHENLVKIVHAIKHLKFVSKSASVLTLLIVFAGIFLIKKVFHQF